MGPRLTKIERPLAPLSGPSPAQQGTYVQFPLLELLDHYMSLLDYFEVM